jgi:hypothetical protein
MPPREAGLPTGAGNGTEHLPAGAFHLPNDARLASASTSAAISWAVRL